MADFLDEKRQEIDVRLKELRPLVDEFTRLEKAAAALAGVSGDNGSGAPTRRRSRATAQPAARRGAKGSRAQKRKGAGTRGRPRGSGQRGQQALTLVQGKPGITIAELAEEMGIKANYLYRVMPALESEGQVTKRDGGWYPANS